MTAGARAHLHRRRVQPSPARRSGTSRNALGRCRAGRARATPRTVHRQGAAASHSVSSVVLPNPAGADTSVSADSAPRLRRSLSLGRATRARRRLGTWSLVSSSGPAMTTSLRTQFSRVCSLATSVCGRKGRMDHPPLGFTCDGRSSGSRLTRWCEGSARACSQRTGQPAIGPRADDGEYGLVCSRAHTMRETPGA